MQTLSFGCLVNRVVNYAVYQTVSAAAIRWFQWLELRVCGYL